ncbi:MAG: hypothetical protein P4L51_15505 [Puia sp.]|nr:hypothetical protein [Puia sp.]
MKQVFLLFLFSSVVIYGFPMVIASGNTVVIDQPVYEDLYLSGGTVMINAPVHGDIVVAGGTIYINDSVTRDILLAGGRATINGCVGGKIRCIGGTLRIGKDVQGDLVIAGGRVFVDKGATIFGSLLATGGELVLNGIVMGDVQARMGQFILYGKVGRDLDCRGGNIDIEGSVAGKALLAASGSLDIGSNASFLGEVRYWSPDKGVDFWKTLNKGNAIRDESLAIQQKHWYFFGAATFLGVLWYLGMGLVAILLLQYLFAPLFSKAGDTVFSHILQSLGMGVGFLFGVPLLIVLAFITLIGIPLGLILLFGYISMLLFCSGIVSVVAANWLNNRGEKSAGYRSLVVKAFGIFILLRLILFTPFLGWFLFFLLVCISFGAILLNIKWRRTGSIKPSI